MTITQEFLMRAKEVNLGIYYYLIQELYQKKMLRKFQYLLNSYSNSHSIELMFPEIIEYLEIHDRILFKHRIDMEVKHDYRKQK